LKTPTSCEYHILPVLYSPKYKPGRPLFTRKGNGIKVAVMPLPGIPVGKEAKDRYKGV
jgi:hypothetical protein